MPLGTGPLRDRYVTLVDENGNPINAGNPLWTTGGGGGGGSSVADKGAFVEGTTLTTLLSGAYDEVLGADPSEDSAIAIRATLKRALHVNLRTAAGAEFGSGDLVIGSVAYTVKQAAISANTSGDTTVVAAVVGKSIRVLTLLFACDAAVAVGWKSNVTVLISPMSFSATGGVESSRLPYAYLFQTAVSEDLKINLNGNVGVHGTLNYIEV